MLQREHSAILLTFIKLPIVTKIFVLSIFEWPFYKGFTVFINMQAANNLLDLPGHACSLARVFTACTNKLSTLMAAQTKVLDSCPLVSYTYSFQ